MQVQYYVTFDPHGIYGEPLVRVYEREIARPRYRLRADLKLPDINLNLTMWKGEYQAMNHDWLRWTDADGNLILTGQERAEAERAQAEFEHARAEQETRRAEFERTRAENEHQRAETEAAARQRAETEIEQLKAELARLQMPRD